MTGCKDNFCHGRICHPCFHTVSANTPGTTAARGRGVATLVARGAVAVVILLKA